jgi:hypothetical protein
MRSPRRPALPALILALAACQATGSTAPGPAPEPAAGAPTAAANSIPPPPPVLQLEGAVAVAATAAGGDPGPLSGRGETTIGPRVTFRVELPAAIPDARLSLLDGTFAMTPGSGSREVGRTTALTFTPAEPLAAGARLRLRVDGATRRELDAADGRRFSPLEWSVVVAGAPAPRKPAVRQGARR